MDQTILVTGGAGFVGSQIGAHLKAIWPKARVIALDNLKRRGSELNIQRLLKLGVEFVHGDVRNKADLQCAPKIDWLIECSAEPSVHAGNDGGLNYLIDTNLTGALNCLELARQHDAKFIFLSSSRVYPIEQLKAINLEPTGSQFSVKGQGQGWSAAGIDETFAMDGARSFYGSTKYAAELFIQEYAAQGLKTVINRCGVIAGPWQMGKVDQGFVSLWLSRHLWGGNLSYLGFGGEGLQVRDILHVSCLAELVALQIEHIEKCHGEIFNVGGGKENSLSLSMLTKMAQDLTHNQLNIKQVSETKAVDIPYYVTNNSKITNRLNWQPKRGINIILEDTLAWLNRNEHAVKEIFGL